MSVNLASKASVEVLQSEAKISTTRFYHKIAQSDDEIEQALRLRFEVFNLEMNEGLKSSYLTGLDIDEYDAICDHLIVLDAETNLIVGTYRVLLSERAESSIGYYSETEFDLTAIRRLKANKLELGRSCVRKDYRGTAVLHTMWSAIAQYILKHNVQYLFGCASIHSTDGSIVGGIYNRLKDKYLSDDYLRVKPLKKVPDFDAEAVINDEQYQLFMPILLKGYLRLGAQICGEPAFDEEFGVSDFFVMLDKNKILKRYKEHYL